MAFGAESTRRIRISRKYDTKALASIDNSLSLRGEISVIGMRTRFIAQAARMRTRLNRTRLERQNFRDANGVGLDGKMARPAS